MATKRMDVTDELMESLREGAAIIRGEVEPSRLWAPPADVDVRGIRKRVGLSQAEFGRRFGFSPSAVRDWEQGRRRPDPAARTLLLVIDRHPDVVDEALRAGAPVAA